jgi:hypothetical protein
MITFFTTTKAFEGKNKINQVNALKSWLIGGAEVIVFGESPGLSEISKELKLHLIPDIKCSQNGVPLINHMFAKASEVSKFSICCFINADILLTNDFFLHVNKICKNLKEKYLIVGQRVDLEVDEYIDFNEGWEKTLFERGTLHNPSGSDYFIFPKGQYNLNNMPDLVVGRPGWDLWMIYNARKNKYKTIDLSYSVKVLHQNHDYSHKVKNEDKRKEEDVFNFKFFPKGQHNMYTLEACNYYFWNNKLYKNFARGDFNLFKQHEYFLFGDSFLLKLNRKYISKWRFNISPSMPYMKR